MPDRSKTRPRDPNELAYRIMLESTGQAPKTEPPEVKKKNPAAVALGRTSGRWCAAAPRAPAEMAIDCHTFRATGITDYLTNGGRIEVA